MNELNDFFGPESATCPVCGEPCELTTCKVDEDGHAVHEHCYVLKLKRLGDTTGYS
jgi:hypothetical protein